MSIENEDIYKLLCNVHTDIGELKSATTSIGAALKDHIVDDQRVMRAMYDTQIQPLTAQVDALRIDQAQQRGRTKAWGLLATGAGVVASALGGLAAFKWH
jgi:hypothetical protein